MKAYFSWLSSSAPTNVPALLGRGLLERRLLRYAMLGSALLVAVPACSSQAPYVWAAELSRPAPSKASSRVEVGDTIAIAVRAQDHLTGTHVVGLDGYVVMPLVGSVRVAGLEPSAIAKVLEKQLSVSLSAPQVSVVLMAKRKLEVSVLGEVTNPGKYPIDPRDGMAAALALAGGLSEFADEDSIYLVRESSPRIRFRMLDLVSGGAGALLPLRDGDLVVVE